MRVTIVCVLLSVAVAVRSQETPSSPAIVIVPSNATTTQSNFTALSQMDSLKIKLQDIPTLTFKAGRLATRQRLTPIPQLTCISGCVGELPTSVQCENKGFDGVSVNWKCQANIQKGRKLENTKVRCEAFTEGDRQYILAGSCALEYSLGGRSGSSSAGRGNQPAYAPTDHHSKSPLHFIVPIIMIVILVIIICAIAKACKRSGESSGVVMGPPPGQSGGYYGGGGAAYPAQPGFNPGYGQPGYVAPMAAPMVAPSGRSGTSALGAGVGGFAAGAATGGLLGYMMGNHGSGGHSYGHSYGTYGGGGGGGGDYNTGDMGGGGGYEMSTDFADTAME